MSNLILACCPLFYVMEVKIYFLTISGSSITFDKAAMPLKNIPIIKPFEKEEKLSEIYTQGMKKRDMYEGTAIAVLLVGPKSPSYEEVKLIGNEIIKLFKEINGPII